jgi:hypothetical protein
MGGAGARARISRAAEADGDGGWLGRRLGAADEQSERLPRIQVSCRACACHVLRRHVRVREDVYRMMHASSHVRYPDTTSGWLERRRKTRGRANSGGAV